MTTLTINKKTAKADNKVLPLVKQSINNKVSNEVKELLKEAEPKTDKKKDTDKSIETIGTPKGINPIQIPEKAQILPSSVKLSALKDALLDVKQADTRLIDSQAFYIEKYYSFGLKVIEFKEIYKIDYKKKSLSDKVIANLFNAKFPENKISRVFVIRARLLAENYLNINDKQKKALIDGKSWREPSEAEKAAEQKQKADSLDILARDIKKAQKEYGSLDLILESLIPSLIETFSKRTVEDAIKHYFSTNK